MEEIIDILMPTLEGRYIPQEVIEGILIQNIPFRLWVSTKVSSGNYADARNNIKQYGKSKYLLMLDNDIVLPPNSLPKMVDFLESNDNFAAIALSKYGLPHGVTGVYTPPHVEMSCVLFRKETLDRITFSTPSLEGRILPGGSCECAQCCYDIRQMGYEIGFLTDFKAVHITDTKNV